jgi:ribosomal 50S subunit-recycling heat shock protein
VTEAFPVVNPLFLRYTYFVRVDLFLKSCRFVKRRTIAREMCNAGRVLVNGHEAKPSNELNRGDRVALQFTRKSIEFDVLALPDRKSVQKANVQALYYMISKKCLSEKTVDG